MSSPIGTHHPVSTQTAHSTAAMREEVPTSKISMVPSLVPTSAWRLPGANSAHRPYPLSMVRRQAPVRGFHTWAGWKQEEGVQQE